MSHEFLPPPSLSHSSQLLDCGNAKCTLVLTAMDLSRRNTVQGEGRQSTFLKLKTYFKCHLSLFLNSKKKMGNCFQLEVALIQNKRGQSPVRNEAGNRAADVQSAPFPFLPPLYGR